MENKIKYEIDIMNTHKIFNYKKYYQDHKEDMKKAIKENYPNQIKRSILKKLNNNEYKRIPHLKLDKYNIIFDKETQKYI